MAIPESNVYVVAVRVITVVQDRLCAQCESSDSPTDDADDDLEYPKSDEGCFPPNGNSIGGLLIVSWCFLHLVRGAGSGSMARIDHVGKSSKGEGAEDSRVENVWIDRGYYGTRKKSLYTQKPSDLPEQDAVA